MAFVKPCKIRQAGIETASILCKRFKRILFAVSGADRRKTSKQEENDTTVLAGSVLELGFLWVK
ncbi:hypothetical protein JCM31739_20640 [Faecalimonas canis]